MTEYISFLPAAASGMAVHLFYFPTPLLWFLRLPRSPCFSSAFSGCSFPVSMVGDSSFTQSFTGVSLILFSTHWISLSQQLTYFHGQSLPGCRLPTFLGFHPAFLLSPISSFPVYLNTPQSPYDEGTQHLNTLFFSSKPVLLLSRGQYYQPPSHQRQKPGMLLILLCPIPHQALSIFSLKDPLDLSTSFLPQATVQPLPVSPCLPASLKVKWPCSF